MLDHLQALGLTPKEAAIYLALLELGVASPVSTISKRARINRTTAYDILELLSSKGLVIIIESREIAQVFKQTFELAWEAAGKYHKNML